MLKRTLGRSGVEISAMGLGCWAIGGLAWRGETPVGWGKIVDAESLRAIRRAVDLGVTFFDTADAYGAGHSERVLGRALAGVRERVVIATKFGNLYDEETRQLGGAEASPKYIRRACEASLRRLNTDVIDLYQFHLGGYDSVRAVEVRGTLEELVRAGKIRFYGWSTDDPERAAVFAEGPHCVAVQQQFNVLQGNDALLALCEALNLASINRGPLAMGLLTGKYGSESRLPDDDVRGPHSPAWMRYFEDGRPSLEWLDKLDAVREVLTSGGRTLAQGALAWLWGRSAHTIPIPGFKTVAQVEENAGALAFGPLGEREMREVERLLGLM
jgi:aryl-alcohol dehydrogenase-like predicted oxidoreductase